jgi:alpha/beta superfamily hydrolase
VSIGYPFSYLWALTFFNSTLFLTKAKSLKPKLFVVGTKDNFTSLESFRKSVEDFPEPKELQVVRGADHFFFGIEDDVAKLVDKWILANLSLQTS